jgi:hypothetical protein
LLLTQVVHCSGTASDSGTYVETFLLYFGKMVVSIGLIIFFFIMRRFLLEDATDFKIF